MMGRILCPTWHGKKTHANRENTQQAWQGSDANLASLTQLRNRKREQTERMMIGLSYGLQPRMRSCPDANLASLTQLRGK